MKKHYQISKTVFGSIDHNIDPIHSNDKYQAGGTITLIQGKWTTTAHNKEIVDPTGLGRWTGVTVTGTQSRALSIIMGYRTCKGNINSSGLGTTFHREYAYYREKGIKMPNPRKAYLNDLEAAIQSLQTAGHGVVVMMDANEVVTTTGELAGWMSRLDLFDLHKAQPAPSTYLGSNNRRIDFMFGCSRIREYVSSAGTLSYIEGPQSDHRGLFIDIDLSRYLSYDPNSNPHITPGARTLRTGNPELVSKYISEMLNYYECHSMATRIEELYNNFQTMTEDQIRSKLEAWDRDQGRAMKKAEKEISIPKKQYEWSPILRNAAITRRYWRLRLRQSKYGEDFRSTIARMREQIQQHDPTFQFPFHDSQLSLNEITGQLNQSTKQLHECQKAATENRFKLFQDLLATYQDDNDPVTRPESNRKAKSFHFMTRSYH